MSKIIDKWVNEKYTTGPTTSTDHAIARFNGTDGKTIQDSGVTIDDSGNVNSSSGTFTENSIGLISKGIIDAKGDIIVGTADNTPSKLTVGATNGHVLTIDSSQTTGLKWAAASVSGSGIPTYYHPFFWLGS